jgi:hypothetical protein
MPGVMLLPLVKLKECHRCIVALFILCLASALGQAQASKQASEWSLRLETGGARFEKKFEVELHQSGRLLVKEQGPGGAPDNAAMNITRDLSQKEAQEIYTQALRAFREFRFAEEDIKRHDGTNLTLRLKANERVLVMQFFHVGQVKEESPEAAKVLSLINKYLPQGHQAY